MRIGGDMVSTNEVGKILFDIHEERDRAVMLNGKFASCHEAMSVLDEEVFEVKMEVYKKEALRDKELLYKEIIQVAAVALKWAEQVKEGMAE